MAQEQQGVVQKVKVLKVWQTKYKGTCFKSYCWENSAEEQGAEKELAQYKCLIHRHFHERPRNITIPKESLLESIMSASPQEGRNTSFPPCCISGGLFRQYFEPFLCFNMSHDCDGRSLRFEDRALEGNSDLLSPYELPPAVITKSLTVVFFEGIKPEGLFGSSIYSS